jgi:hypothetical protein
MIPAHREEQRSQSHEQQHGGESSFPRNTLSRLVRQKVAVDCGGYRWTTLDVNMLCTAFGGQLIRFAGLEAGLGVIP